MKRITEPRWNAFEQDPKLGKLTRHIPKSVADIKVQRMDYALFKRRPDLLVDEWNFVGTENQLETLLLLDLDGNVLGQVGEVHHEAPKRTWWNRHPEPWVDFIYDETVEEALMRIGAQRNNVYYILSVNEKYDASADECVEIATIFKPPKDYNIQGWIEAEEQRAKEALAKEIAAVDTV